MTGNMAQPLNEALLVIDMQKGCFKTPRYDSSGTFERINTLTSFFRDQGRPVIFIQHNGSAENWLLPGSDDFSIVSELEVKESDEFMVKTINDAFYRSGLKTRLDQLGVNALCLCGLATDFCVNATLHAALVQDYHIRVAADAHTTADKCGLSAEQIIQYHNFLWSQLMPAASPVRVENHTDIIAVSDNS